MSDSHDSQAFSAIAPILSFCPFMSTERYAHMIGQPKGVVRGWMDKGYIPTAVFGRRRLVNIAKLTRDALKDCP
jgi:hypothetical protein